MHDILAKCISDNLSSSCVVFVFAYSRAIVDPVQHNFVPYVKEVWPPTTTVAPNVGLFCFPEDIDANFVMELKK